MNQTRLGPRRWAFVVVAGGALLALPFTQRSKSPPPTPAAETDALASLEALADAVSAPLPDSAASTPAGLAPGETEPTSKLPAWAQARQSPFDELMNHTAKVPEIPAPDVLPLQPLRPWITPPPKSEAAKPASDQLAPRSDNSLVAVHSPASVTPWPEEKEPSQPPQASHSQIASASIDTKPARELSVNAWPDEKFSDGQVARQLTSKHQLQSAIVSPDQVLVPSGQSSQVASALPPAITRQTVREPAMRSVAAPKIRFGQSGEPSKPLEETFVPPLNMQPLPSLPEARKSHVIFQPSQPSRR